METGRLARGIFNTGHYANLPIKLVPCVENSFNLLRKERIWQIIKNIII